MIAALAIALWTAPMLAQRSEPLTLQQLEQLLDLKMPDSALSKEIMTRGLAFPVYRRTLLLLHKHDVGPETMKALGSQVVETRLTISTRPATGGCEITVGPQKYLTDAAGQIQIDDLVPGVYSAIMRKAQYRDQQITFRVIDKPSALEVSLIPLGGFLTVTGPGGLSQIKIEGKGVWRNSVEKLALQPGTYHVTVTAPYRTTFEKDVVINGGDNVQLNPEMELDKAALDRLHTEINFALKNHSYPAAIGKSSELLALVPGDREALSVQAEAYFSADQFDRAFQAGIQALNAGATLEFAVLHHHNLFMPTHSAKIELSSASLTYVPEARCSVAGFQVPFQDIVKVEIVRNQNNEIFLNMVIRNPTNPQKTSVLDFADSQSQIREITRNSLPTRILVPRPQAEKSLLVIQQLLENARARSTSPVVKNPG